MIYAFYVVLNMILSVICYITNPVVVMFADERGELHGFWKNWQTWDDSVDVEWFVETRVPACLRYDFDKHYISSRETTPELARVGRDKGCVIIRDGNFTNHERWQRYCCRALWLTRNNGYGFAFRVFGMKTRGADMVMVKNIRNGNDELLLAYDKSRNILMRPWILCIDWPIVGKLRWNIFLGWKIDYTSGEMERQAMIANRIAFRIED